MSAGWEEKELSRQLDEHIRNDDPLAPKTFRQRMDENVRNAEMLLDASRKMLAAAEAMLEGVNASLRELQ